MIIQDQNIKHDIGLAGNGKVKKKMKYRNLSSIIKEVVGGTSQPNVYYNLDTAIKAIMSGSPKELERHSEDQISVGTYRTKNFEMSPDAQIFFTSLPKDVDNDSLEKSAMAHDTLYTMLRKIRATGTANERDIAYAERLKNNIDLLHTNDSKIPPAKHLEKEVEEIRSYLGKQGYPFGISSSKETGELGKDLDIDMKNFPVSRANSMQRKIKIFDDD